AEAVFGCLDLLGAGGGGRVGVRAAVLVVGGIAFALVKGRPPLFAPKCVWPDKTAIDAPLVVGAALFGIGWGLCGLCPGPALENLATLSPRLLVFVAAIALGMTAHDAWQRRRSAAGRQTQARTSRAHGQLDTTADH